MQLKGNILCKEENVISFLTPLGKLFDSGFCCALSLSNTPIFVCMTKIPSKQLKPQTKFFIKLINHLFEIKIKIFMRF